MFDSRQIKVTNMLRRQGRQTDVWLWLNADRDAANCVDPDGELDSDFDAERFKTDLFYRGSVKHYRRRNRQCAATAKALRAG